MGLLLNKTGSCLCTAVPLIHLIVLATMFATFDPLIDALNGVLIRVAQYRGASAVFGIILIFIIFPINTHYIIPCHGCCQGDGLSDHLPGRATASSIQ